MFNKQSTLHSRKVSPASTKQRFLYLDLARGMAAIVVLSFHLQEFFPWNGLIGGSFLAVDLFFLMSGFVIAHSYQERLINGNVSPSNFLWLRVLRLYPLYLCASGIGGIYFVSKMIMAVPDAPRIAELTLALPASALVLPGVGTQSWGFTMFPFAPSAWSLALELWFSVAFGVFLFRWRTSTLLVLVCIAFIALCHQARAFNTVDLGWSLNNLSGGAARFWFSFTLGVVLKRVSINRTLPVAVPRASLAIVFLFIFVPHNNPFIQLASVALLFPTFLLIATNSEPGGLLASISDHLGRLSYAIYILHAPVILLVLGSAKVLLPGFAHANPISTGTTILLLVLALSAILTYGFDEPVRKGILKLRSTSNRHQVTAKA